MSKFTITQTVSGAIIGEFQAETEAEALDASARAAGYKSFADQCAVTGDDPENHTLLIENHDRLTLHGDIVPLDACAELMDDEIRERLHFEMAPCGAQEFLDAYVAAHAEKFDGEAFTI